MGYWFIFLEGRGKGGGKVMYVSYLVVTFSSLQAFPLAWKAHPVSFVLHRRPRLQARLGRRPLSTLGK